MLYDTVSYIFPLSNLSLFTVIPTFNCCLFYLKDYNAASPKYPYKNKKRPRNFLKRKSQGLSHTYSIYYYITPQHHIMLNYCWNSKFSCINPVWKVWFSLIFRHFFAYPPYTNIAVEPLLIYCWVAVEILLNYCWRLKIMLSFLGTNGFNGPNGHKKLSKIPYF